MHGDELAPNQVVTIDGKPIMVDIREVNVEEGWVEIELPSFESKNTIDKSGAVDERDIPLFDTEVKRLTGKVKIIELTPPTD